MSGNDKDDVLISAGRNVAYAKGNQNVVAGENIQSANTGTIAQPTIQLNQEYIKRMDKEYATALQEFIEKVNQQLRNENVTNDKLEQVQENFNSAAKEMENVKPTEEIPSSKEYSIGGKLASAVEGLIDISPTIAETVVSTIPILSPFSKIVGQGLQKVVDRFKKRKTSS